MASFAIRKVVESSYEAALAAIPEALKTEGFGILTEIDVQATLKQKLGVDMRRYRILGACNPPLAHRALGAEPDIGVMLPCNVVVYEDTEGRTVVAAIDPMQTIAAQGSAELRELAAVVRDKLSTALSRVE